jgi:hypothetical protein
LATKKQKNITNRIRIPEGLLSDGVPKLANSATNQLIPFYQTKPVLLHFVDGEQFTSAAWSLTHPSFIFFAGENGNLQVANQAIQLNTLRMSFR